MYFRSLAMSVVSINFVINRTKNDVLEITNQRTSNFSSFSGIGEISSVFSLRSRLYDLRTVIAVFNSNKSCSILGIGSTSKEFLIAAFRPISSLNILSRKPS